MAEIEIIGDDNYVLINDTYKNLILHSRANLTFYKFDSSTSTLGGYCSHSVQVAAGSFPILAVRSGFPIAYRTCTIANGVATWTFVCSAGGVGQTAEAFIFYLPETVQNAGGLVQLFNAEGKIVFDSNLKYAKAETQINFELSPGVSRVLTPGHTYAVCSVLGPREYSDLPVDAGGPGGFRMNRITKYTGVYASGITVGTSLFEYSNLSYRAASPVGAYNLNNFGSMLVFDLTTLGL